MNRKAETNPLFFIFLFIVGIYAAVNLLVPDSDVVQLLDSDGISEISCGSDSMGLSLDCKNNVRYHYVSEEEPIEMGEMYIYTRPFGDGIDILHRVVGCIRVVGVGLEEVCYYDESYLIFKGDNNAVMDVPLKYNADLNLRKVDMIVVD